MVHVDIISRPENLCYYSAHFIAARKVTGIRNVL